MSLSKDVQKIAGRITPYGPVATRDIAVLAGEAVARKLWDERIRTDGVCNPPVIESTTIELTHDEGLLIIRALQELPASLLKEDIKKGRLDEHGQPNDAFYRTRDEIGRVMDKVLSKIDISGVKS